MERIGAFEREVIVLIAPTGSGWIDPYAIDGIEYLHNGNTAAVAIQYSHLASWMVMIGNQDLTRDAAGSLLAAVNERVSRLPEEERPKFSSAGRASAHSGGSGSSKLRRSHVFSRWSLWVGPPRSGPLWKQVVTDREPGTPLWRPVYRGGETIRKRRD